METIIGIVWTTKIHSRKPLSARKGALLGRCYRDYVGCVLSYAVLELETFIRGSPNACW